MTPIEFRSDNAAGVAPEIVRAVADANVGSALAYGDDDVTRRAPRRRPEVFEHETARVFPVTSGTAANALALTAMCPPWGAVLCHETAHILNSEGGATSMLGGGAVMKGVGGDDFRVGPDELRGSARRRPLGRPAPLATDRALAHLADRHGHDLPRRRDRRTRRRSPVATVSASISTARGSRTRSWHSAARRPR